MITIVKIPGIPHNKSFNSFLKPLNFRKQFRFLAKKYNTDYNFLADIILFLSNPNAIFWSEKDYIRMFKTLAAKAGAKVHDNEISTIYNGSFNFISGLSADEEIVLLQTIGVTDQTFINAECLLVAINIEKYKNQNSICYSCSLNINCDFYKAFYGRSMQLDDLEKNAGLMHKECPINKISQEYDPAGDTKLSNTEYSKELIRQIVNQAGQMKANFNANNCGNVTGKLNNSSAPTSATSNRNVIINSFMKTVLSDKNGFLNFLREQASSTIKTQFNNETMQPDEEELLEIRIDDIRDEDQLHKVIPKDLALSVISPEAFAEKLDSNSLRIKQNYANKTGDILILLDVSGSMSSPIYNIAWCGASYGDIASTYLAAFLDRISLTSEDIYFREFAHSLSELKIVKDDADIKNFRSYISTISYSGGGTELEAALDTIINDYNTNVIDPKKVELLIISDLETSISDSLVNKINACRSSMSLKTRICLLGRANTSASKQLQKCSDIFMGCDFSASPTEQMFTFLNKI